MTLTSEHPVVRERRKSLPVGVEPIPFIRTLPLRQSTGEIVYAAHLRVSMELPFLWSVAGYSGTRAGALDLGRRYYFNRVAPLMRMHGYL